MENEFLTSLIDNKKLILLLDIDNTILHATHINISEKEYTFLKNKYEWQFTSFRIKNERFFLKLRPYLKNLFEYIILYKEPLKTLILFIFIQPEQRNMLKTL